ncbi:hypothetical protein [uncultured Bradyrhizobium sp.]|uniref:hypothetical protein n=1 Tax=uncultured Bradyrhizobium sp. TaxID=199684 RepID=UPI0035CB4E6F
MQVVDDSNNVIAFEPFIEIFNIEHVAFTLDQKLGDPAFWYFKLEDEPLVGTIETIRSLISVRQPELQANPFVCIQVKSACGLEVDSAVIKSVHKELRQTGGAGAAAWLDTSILTPRIRALFSQHLSDDRRRPRDRRLIEEILAFTGDGTTTVLVPENLKIPISERTEQIKQLLATFDLKFSEFMFTKGSEPAPGRQTDVTSLKRAAVKAFGAENGITLRQITKSYFEDSQGALRVVCTFSSRYEGKGKRKYWFGFHEIWNRWLEDSESGFLILGCIDSRTCFALPLGFVRDQLPHLRTTGTGKDRYWHIDIVDLGGKKNLLDLPHLHKQISLSDFLLRF